MISAKLATLDFFQELRNYKQKLFLCLPQTKTQNRRKHNQHFKLLFSAINLHSVTSNQIYTFRKLNLPLTSSIYFIFLPLEMQKRLKQTKVCHAFSYFVWKETTHKPLKVAAANSLFSAYSMLLVQLVIGTACAILLLSLKPVFWKKFLFYALSPH